MPATSRRLALARLLAVILWIQGHPDKAREWSAATIDYTRELNQANNLRAWLIALDGDLSEGIRLMRRTIEERFSLGVSWYQVRYLCMLADLCHQHGEAGAGLDLLARAMRHIEDHEEHMWRAEALRLKAEMLRLKGPSHRSR